MTYNAHTLSAPNQIHQDYEKTYSSDSGSTATPNHDIDTSDTPPSSVYIFCTRTFAKSEQRNSNYHYAYALYHNIWYIKCQRCNDNVVVSIAMTMLLCPLYQGNYSMSEPWNSLPDTVVTAKSLNSFKTLDKFWYNQDIVYDFEAPLRITNNRTGTRDFILIDNENEELITEEYRNLRSEPS